MPRGGFTVPFAASQPYDYGNSRITDLILRAGDIAAQGSAQRGAALGGLAAGLGESIGAIAGERERQKMQRQSMDAQDRALQSGDPREIISVFGAKDGADIIKALATLKPEGQKPYKDRMELFRDTARGIQALPPEKRASAYAFARGELIKSGAASEEEAPPEYNEELLSFHANWGMAPKEPKEPKQYEVTVPGPGGVPIKRLASAEEMATGVQQYVAPPAPREPKEPRLVQVDTVDEQGRPVTKFVTPEAGAAFAKPTGQARPATGQQRKALGYFNRMTEADDVAQQLETTGKVDPTKIKYTPEIANFMLDDANQAYKQAQRAFTEARLRKESGAAIPAHEYENDARTYFVQPGDSAATIEQKRRMRQAVKAGAAFESGDALREFYGPEAEGMLAQLQQASKSEQPKGQVTAAEADILKRYGY